MPFSFQIFKKGWSPRQPLRKSLLSAPMRQINSEEREAAISSNSRTNQRKPPGWKATPYIIGNETFERLGTIGMSANLQKYLVDTYHMDQVRAASMLLLLSSMGNFLTLGGGLLADAYTGKFWTITFSSFANLLNKLRSPIPTQIWRDIPTNFDGANFMAPAMHPTAANSGSMHRPSSGKLAIFVASQCLMAIGSAGIRPCSIPFGVDQFDATTCHGSEGIRRYFNWYYFTQTAILFTSASVMVYIQQENWALGFSIPTVFMLLGIVLFLVGTRTYVYIKPEGSVFSNIAKVLVAAYKKRHCELPVHDGTFLYDPPLPEVTIVQKLPPTKEFGLLGKAAILTESDLKPDGSPANPWELCSIQQVEEVKCFINVLSIWVTTLVGHFCFSQQIQFLLPSAEKMDRHLGPKFQLHQVSIGSVSLVTVAISLPLYDYYLAPAAEKITKIDGGITVLQRIGIGNMFVTLAMVVQAVVEKKRRESAMSHGGIDGISPTSVWWLAPQHILMGLFEAISIVGAIEFYNREIPENIRSIGTSLFSLKFGGAGLGGSLMISLVQRFSGNLWLNTNANAARLDYYFFLIAAMTSLNFVLFLFCARRYHHKSNGIKEAQPCHDSMEPESEGSP